MLTRDEFAVANLLV